MEIYSDKEGIKDTIMRNKDREKLIQLGTDYANISVALSFKIETIYGLESSGRYQDRLLLDVNGKSLFEECLGDGSGSSFGKYSLVALTDADGNLNLTYRLLCTSNGERYKVSEIVVDDQPIFDKDTVVVSCNEMKLEADSSTDKTYCFGKVNADRKVKLSFLANSVVGWNDHKNDNDVFRVLVNDSEVVSTSVSKKHFHEIEVLTDSDGKMVVTLEDVTDGDKGLVFVSGFEIKMLEKNKSHSSDGMVL